MGINQGDTQLMFLRVGNGVGNVHLRNQFSCDLHKAFSVKKSDHSAFSLCCGSSHRVQVIAKCIAEGMVDF